VTSPRVVHVGPSELANARALLEPRWAELRRIFGQDVEILEVSPVGLSPRELVEEVRAAQADAAVIVSALPEQRRAIQKLGAETLNLRPMYEEYRTARGELRERRRGFGVAREGGHPPTPISGGAFTHRSAIAKELAIQNALRREQSPGD